MWREINHLRELFGLFSRSDKWPEELFFVYFKEKLLFSGTHFILREKFYFEEKLSF